MALEIGAKRVKRRPIAKNCRFCGKFMELGWVEEGAVKGLDYQGYSLVPIFYCSDCNESDNVITNPEDYEWLLYGAGTIDFEEAKKELSPQDYFFLLLDYHRMRRRFQNRQYLAIPRLA